MIKTIKTILKRAIIHETLLLEFSSVFRKNKKEKTYKIKLTEDNINLLIACYKYGIKNENELCQTIRQQSLSDYESKLSQSKSCAKCVLKNGCNGQLTIGSAEYCQYYRDST